MKDDSVFIEHILDSINAIEIFSNKIDKEKLISDRLKQSAIVREVEVIGEAVKNISEILKNKHPEVKWREIDKMIHYYFGIDLNIVWGIVKIDLPDLKNKMLKIKRELK